MRVYYMHAEQNFGDLLTPHILNFFGIDHDLGSTSKHDAIMVGSIAKFARHGTFVLGSGFIREDDPVCTSALWWWVRGPKTREKVLAAGGKVGSVMGDPGALLPLMWPAAEKRFALGITPHYVDLDIARERFPGARIINLKTNDPQRIAREISECERVISSSLHGLVVAHAYGIPAAWVPLSNRLYGDGFKFADYFASIGLPPMRSTVEEPVFTEGALDTAPMVKVLNECKSLRW